MENQTEYIMLQALIPKTTKKLVERMSVELDIPMKTVVKQAIEEKYEKLLSGEKI
jgi:hypothetical protein